MNNPSKLGISLIICCYNSAGRLPETLKHIASTGTCFHPLGGYNCE